ncbi:MAG TPA: glycine cleavage system protein H [Anaeromyxobacteraceae bacterium]|nr:glycine cleavage system protein H [Anaeromyxobacteraceae bacterium]
MHGSEFLSGYAAKLIEYGLAVTYLVLFVGFWRYVQGGRRPAEAASRAAASSHAEAAPVHTGWFGVPDGVALHPGHTWARLEGDGSVSVGLDDLGHRLVGDVDGMALPHAGARVEQGEPAATLRAGGKAVRIVSPVDGEVIAYNADPGSDSPYEQGWLFKVRPTDWRRSKAQLLDGQAARHWLEEQGRRLASRLSPGEPVPVLQDGGAPVHGIAREIDPEHWDDVAREFFRTQET